MKRAANNARSRRIRFNERVTSWAETVRVRPAEIRLQRMTRKWGSCSTRGRVTFSFDLLDQADGFQDYVVIHELLHLKVPNHGKLFKCLLATHCPDWKRWDERAARQGMAFQGV